MKQVVGNYTFSTSAKTITLSDFSSSHPVILSRLYLITDVTTNTILYNFADSTVATASVSSNNVITLSTVPGSSSSSDTLTIIYEAAFGDPLYEIPQTYIQGFAGNGSALSGNPILSAMSDGTDVRTINNIVSTTATTGTNLLGVGIEGYNGTNYEALTVNSSLTTGKYALDNNIISILGTAPTSAGFLNVQGSSTSAAAPFYAVTVGGQAVSSDPTATTSTFNTPPLMDLLGKTVQLPYAIPNNWVSGTASVTSTTSTVVISAQTGYKIGLTSVQIMNTGTTTTYINMQDSNGSSPTTKVVLQAPAGGGANVTFPVPIYNTSGNGWYFAAGTGSTTLYVSAQGFISKN